MANIAIISAASFVGGAGHTALAAALAGHTVSYVPEANILGSTPVNDLQSYDALLVGLTTLGSADSVAAAIEASGKPALFGMRDNGHGTTGTDLTTGLVMSLGLVTAVHGVVSTWPQHRNLSKILPAWAMHRITQDTHATGSLNFCSTALASNAIAPSATVAGSVLGMGWNNERRIFSALEQGAAKVTAGVTTERYILLGNAIFGSNPGYSAFGITILNRCVGWLLRSIDEAPPTSTTPYHRTFGEVQYTHGQAPPIDWIPNWASAEYTILRGESEVAFTDQSSLRVLCVTSATANRSVVANGLAFVDGSIRARTWIPATGTAIPHVFFRVREAAAGADNGYAVTLIYSTSTDPAVGGWWIHIYRFLHGLTSIGRHQVSGPTTTSLLRSKWINFSVNAVGTLLRAKVWAETAPEPSEWQVEAVDNIHTYGGVGCGFTGNVSTGHHFFLDEITVNGESPSNAAPVVTITTPDGQSIPLGSMLELRATAADAEDGDLTSGIAWSSSVNGALGTGGSVDATSLSEGTHVITATVTDSGGATGSATITITVLAGPRPDRPTITVPEKGDSFAELYSSDYSHPDSVAHGFVRWLVWTTAGTLVHDSDWMGVDEDNAWRTYIATDLNPSTGYKASVAHADTNGVSSLQAVQVAFTTTTTPAIRPAKPTLSLAAFTYRFVSHHYGGVYDVGVDGSPYSHPEGAPHQLTSLYVKEVLTGIASTDTFGGTATLWDVPGLTPGQQYIIQVAYWGGGARGPWSDPLIVNVPTQLLNPDFTEPRSLVSYAGPELLVKWEYKYPLPGAVIDGLRFDLQYAQVDADDWQTLVSDTAAYEYLWNIGALPAGTYVLRITTASGSDAAGHYKVSSPFFVKRKVFSPGLYNEAEWGEAGAYNNQRWQKTTGEAVDDPWFGHFPETGQMTWSASVGPVKTGLVRSGGPSFKTFLPPGEPRDVEVWVDFSFGSFSDVWYYYWFNDGPQVWVGAQLNGRTDGVAGDMTGVRGIAGGVAVGGAQPIIPNATLHNNRKYQRTNPHGRARRSTLGLRHFTGAQLSPRLSKETAKKLWYSHDPRTHPILPNGFTLGRIEKAYVPYTMRFRLTTTKVKEGGLRDVLATISLWGAAGLIDSYSQAYTNVDGPCGEVGVGASQLEYINTTDVLFQRVVVVPLAYGECGSVVLPPETHVTHACGTLTVSGLNAAGSTAIITGADLVIRRTDTNAIVYEETRGIAYWYLLHGFHDLPYDVELSARIRWRDLWGGESEWSDPATYTLFWSAEECGSTSVTRPIRKAWAFNLDGHVFYVIGTYYGRTILYDATTGQWCLWKTAGRPFWNMFRGHVWRGRTLAADHEEGVVWELDPHSMLDEGTVAIERAVTGFMPLRGRTSFPQGALRLTGSTEQEDAVVTMRWSDDEGETWSGPHTRVIRAVDVVHPVKFRSLGRVRAPGRLWEIVDTGGIMRIDGLDADIPGLRIEEEKE